MGEEREEVKMCQHHTGLLKDQKCDHYPKHVSDLEKTYPLLKKYKPCLHHYREDKLECQECDIMLACEDEPTGILEDSVR